MAGRIKLSQPGCMICAVLALVLVVCHLCLYNAYVWVAVCPLICRHHQRPIYDLAWSTDGLLATASGDNQIRVFREVGVALLAWESCADYAHTLSFSSRVGLFCEPFKHAVQPAAGLTPR